MQTELAQTKAGDAIHILGLNEAGQERDNSLMSEEGVLPWLQDTVEQDVWGEWGVVWRDVVVLDAGNIPRTVYNLTDHDLRRQSAYDSLKAILIEIAGR
jgi:hypothetical protein